MRQPTLTAARAVLLAGPVALAFFSGGYFDEPRAWAGVVTWALVVVAALATRQPLPRSRPARLTILALALFAAWTLLSVTWAPLAGPAYHEGERVILYLGGLVAAAALLRGAALRWVEIAVGAGALVLVVYGLSERLAPELVTLHHSASALGRLDQPLTYWNATGMIAALGVVLCARVAGDPARAERLRMAAAVAAAPLGLGLYVTFSRGALFALAAGLVTLVVAAPLRATLRGAATALLAGAATAGVAAPFAGVTRLGGSHADRVLEGSVTLLGLLVVALLAAWSARRASRADAAAPAGPAPLRLPRHAPLIALGVVTCVFGLFLLIGAHERGGVQGPGASRLTSLESNRYTYWRVAWRAFEHEPLHGVGSGGWSVWWLRDRPFSEGARDAHSLYVQTLAELGVVGLLLLAAFAAALVWSARRAHRFAPGRAAGPIAGLAVLAAHAAIDWDWELPAVILPGLLLAGALLALCDLSPRPTRAS